jgi:RND family efflux transporter MFP subunit
VAPIKQTYEVQRGEVIERVQFTGRIMPVTQASLVFPVDGRVRTVYAVEGQPVAAGAVIADLNSLDDLEKRKAADELVLHQAELELENAQLGLEIARLQADESVRELEIQVHENNVELAQIRHDLLALSIQDLDDQIAEARLVAPFDGELLTINISAGSNVTEFRPVALYADVTELEIGALVQSFKLELLAEGMPVIVEPASQPGVEIPGVIRRMPYMGQGEKPESDDQLVRVTLSISPEEADLSLDDQVEVTAVVAERQDVIWLPAQALRTFQNNAFVVVRENDIERRSDVVVGIAGGNRVEIVSGLEVGQVVVGP